MTSTSARVIAIDGPSGAGKGTVARSLAAHLRYRHVDTGAMYRAVAWKACHDGIDLGDEMEVARIGRDAEIGVDERTMIDGHDVTAAIRTPEIDRAAAIVARHAALRAVLVERQRAYRTGRGVVMEGRDIGSVVFPDADIKLYLDASVEERARRRSQDVAHAASRRADALSKVAEALEARDHSDRTRSVSPLTQADGAIYIDTTGAPIDDVVRRVLDIVEARLGRQGSTST